MASPTRRPRGPKSAAPASIPLPGEPAVQRLSTAGYGGAFGSYGAGGGYNAADNSTMRGYVYFPQIDTRKELTTYSRTEILRRARYLDANVGFAGRIINGLARMVAGTGLMIRPATADRAWNKERQTLFEQRNGSAAAFDVGNRWDFYSAQRGLLRCRYRDGDVGTVLTTSPGGLASVAFVESHRIGSGRLSEGERARIFDGVLVDRNNAAIAYRILGDEQTQADVPAASFCYLGDYASPGKHRTPSILHRACNHLIDMTEINAATKKGIKIANSIGYYISQAASNTGTGIPPMGNGANPTSSVTLSDGTKRTLEQQLSQGGEIPGLPPGSDIKTLLDERPHPNAMEFMKSLARDISWGVDMAPELLYDIAALGGANTRYVMADAQSFIEVEQQNLVDSVLARYYFYDTAMEMAAGRLRRPTDPQWWKHVCIPPARWTVDKGRDGKLYLEQVRSGALTFKRCLGWEGLDSEEQLNDWMDEMRFIADGARERGLDPGLVLERVYGRAGTATTQTSTTATDDEAAAIAQAAAEQAAAGN